MIKQWAFDFKDNRIFICKFQRFTMHFDKVEKCIYNNGYVEYKFYVGNRITCTMEEKYIPKYVKKRMDPIAEIKNIQVP